jgi:S1-C subfamily serine protease
MPRAQIDLGGGRIVRHGEMHAFEEYLELQRAVVPVVALRDGVLTGIGTAVCIGAGWFLTAAHVVDGLVEDGWEVRVILETDTRISANPLEVFGGAFQVRGIHTHPESDLATLSVNLPKAATSEIRKLKLRLRLPEVGEPVVTVGYPHMAQGEIVDLALKPSVTWERTLSAGVGVVLDHQLERLERPLRGFPGFETDAPTPPGTSGGPVLDRSMHVVGFVSSSTAPGDATEGWNSFIALLGPALELSVLDLETGSHANEAEAPEIRLVQLLADGALEIEAFDSFDVDPTTGKVTYWSTTA